MKKLLFLLLLATTLLHAEISIDIIAGNLNYAIDSPLEPGKLILLLASGADMAFSNTLSIGQYICEDDFILAAFGADNDLNSASTVYESFTISSGFTGQRLALRWFPEIDFPGSGAVLPTLAAGMHYGTYAGPTTGSPNGGDIWVVPEDGTSSHQLNLVTESLRDSTGLVVADAVPNEAAYATYTVAPEPNSLSFILLGASSVLFIRRRSGS